MKSIFLIILIALSIGAFVLYIQPRYQAAREFKAQIASYSSNLDTAEKLKTSREELIARYNNIPKSDLDNLRALLPDNVDNIRLIIQVDSLAVRNGLSTVRNVNYQVQEKTEADSAQTQAVSRTPYEEFVMSFETTGQYQNFLSFLADLERNLRLVDITKIEFLPNTGSTQSTSMQYRVTLKTYWLKQ